MTDVNSFLAHYGVKGMRWGHHKAAPSSDAATALATKRQGRTEGVHTLSNAELRAAIERMNLEQQYHRLNPSPSKKAVKLVADILLGVGKQEAIKFVSGVAANAVKNASKK